MVRGKECGVGYLLTCARSSHPRTTTMPAYSNQASEQMQVKTCAACHCVLNDAAGGVRLSTDAVVCSACSAPIDLVQRTRRLPSPDPFDLIQPPTPPPPAFCSQPLSLPSLPSLPAAPRQFVQSLPQPRRFSPADPLTDITRLRIPSRGHHCLYPGAEFQGTQKSGRNSYDVNVTIVVG